MKWKWNDSKANDDEDNETGCDQLVSDECDTTHDEDYEGFS